MLHVTPDERWLVIYWDIDRGIWALDEVWQDASRETVQRARDLYAAQLGERRVRMLHTADGV